MRAVREWAGSWSFAEILGPEVPWWVGLALFIPTAMGVVAWGSWSNADMTLVVALAGVVVALAMVASEWFVIESGRAFAVIAIHFGTTLVVSGGEPPPVLAATVPVGLAALPVLLKVWGMFAFAIERAVARRRKRARVAAWLAAPDNRGLHIECGRIAGKDLVARVLAPGPEREILVRPRVLRHAAAAGRAFVLFDPVVLPELRPEGYRDLPGERVTHVREVGRIDRDESLIAELVAAALLVIATQAALVGLAFAIAAL